MMMYDTKIHQPNKHQSGAENSTVMVNQCTFYTTLIPLLPLKSEGKCFGVDESH